MKTLGIIGAGNMATAILGGILKAGLVKPSDVTMSDLNQAALDKVKADHGVNTTQDSGEVVKNSDVIIIALKPNVVELVLGQVKDLVDGNKIIVSIAAGKTIAQLEGAVGVDKKIVRTMPNTPALVGEGMAALSKNKNVTDEELQEIKTIFEAFGQAEIIPESLMDAVIGVGGSAPAYVFMFIEAMADGGVIAGMPRAQAYKFAAQSVLGSAKMVLETGKHPGDLKDMVCSPAGTSIEAVKVLEAEGMRSAVIKAVEASVEKSIELSK